MNGRPTLVIQFGLGLLLLVGLAFAAGFLFGLRSSLPPGSDPLAAAQAEAARRHVDLPLPAANPPARTPPPAAPSAAPVAATPPVAAVAPPPPVPAPPPQSPPVLPKEAAPAPLPAADEPATKVQPVPVEAAPAVKVPLQGAKVLKAPPPAVKAAPVAVIAPAPDAPAQADTAKEAVETPPPPPPPPALQAPRKLEPPKATGGNFGLQIAALKLESGAKEMAAELRKEGFPAQVSQGSQFFFVRVGGFRSRADAQGAAAKIAERFRVTPIIQSWHPAPQSSQRPDAEPEPEPQAEPATPSAP